MPNQPKTPHRTIRVPDDEWIPARDKAAREGETMTDVIRRALRRYVSGAAIAALILAVGVGSTSHSAQASAPVAAPMSATSTFVATVRQIGVGTAIDDQTDADLILMGKNVCADLAAGQTRAAYWRRVTSAYSAKSAEDVGITSYVQWVSIYWGWRQSSILTFCPQHL